jgi:predicted nucleic acid-binding protein
LPQTDAGQKKNFADYASKLIIADTSSLSTLNRIGKLDYLKRLFNTVTVTAEIVRECKFTLPDWIIQEDPKTEVIKNLIDKRLDTGEKSAIALAIEKKYFGKDPCVILDDQKARNYLKQKNVDIEVIGLLRVLNFAYQNNFFQKEDIPIIVQELIDDGFRIPMNAPDIIYGGTFTMADQKITPKGIRR